MNAFKKYALAEGVDLGTLGFVPDGGAGLVMLSVRAMAVFEGFAMFVVEGMGNAISTAQQYGTNVRTQINQDTGIDVTLGMEWARLTRLFATLKKVYPQKKRVRKPLLQQDLLRIRGNLDFNEREHTMYWAVLLLNFFGVNRGGDILPQTQRGFDSRCGRWLSWRRHHGKPGSDDAGLTRNEDGLQSGKLRVQAVPTRPW